MPESAAKKARTELAYALGEGLVANVAHRNRQWDGLLDELFTYGKDHCSKSEDEKMLAGLGCVESFLRKIERWGGEELIQARKQHKLKRSDRDSLMSIAEEDSWPRLSGYESEVLIKHYMPDSVRQDISDISKLRIKRRNLLAMGGATILASATAVAVPTFYPKDDKNPPMLPEQKNELLAEDAYADTQRKIERMELPQENNAEQHNQWVALLKEEKLALEEFKRASKQRRDAGLPHYYEAIEAWQPHEPGILGQIFIYGGAIAAVLAMGATAYGAYDIHKKMDEKLADPNVAFHDVNLRIYLANIADRLVVGIEPLLQRIAIEAAERKRPGGQARN